MKRLISTHTHLLALVACFMTWQPLSAQISYDVTCKGLENGKTAYLNDGENRQVLDSAVVTDGVAAFRGQTPETVVALVHYKPAQVNAPLCEMILDETAIVMDSGKLLKGSKLNQRYAQYQEATRTHNLLAETIIADFRAMQTEYGAQIPEEKMNELRRRTEEFSEQSRLLTVNMLEANRDNLIPLLTLLYSADNVGYTYVAEYMKTYKFANRPSLAPLRDMLGKESVKMPGAKVVDFAMQDLKGNTVRLTDWVGKGQYVLVDFWASWCGPCRQEMPNVKADYAKYHPLGFEIVGVSLDNRQSAWEQGVRDLGITWPQMSDLQGWKCVGASLYNIRSIPATILFAPDGTVVETGLRGEALSRKLAEIYAPQKLSE
ncbi:MAG: AhpC/TSA family protein [Bacteroidaceae bacterium]|nr:AhpC/TSA family protein [Bacteroidaceae bacterium]